MQQKTAFLLSLAAIAGSLNEVCCIDSTKLYNSEETKTVNQKLENLMDVGDNAFDDFLNKIAADNLLLPALSKYRATYEQSAGTACKGSEPPSADLDNDLVMTIMSECEEIMNTDDLEDYKSKLEAAEEKVLQIDQALRDNAETCATDAEACAAKKQKLVADLDQVLTEDEIAGHNARALRAVATTEAVVKPCFDEKFQEKAAVLEQQNLALETCLKQH